MKAGYASVSTKEQTVDLQVDALKKAGCTTVYTEIGEEEGGSSSGAARPGACVVAVPWIGGLRPADPVRRQKFAQRRLRSGEKGWNCSYPSGEPARAHFSNTFLTSPTFSWTLPLSFSAVPSASKSGLSVAWPTFSFTLPTA